MKTEKQAIKDKAKSSSKENTKILYLPVTKPSRTMVIKSTWKEKAKTSIKKRMKQRLPDHLKEKAKARTI